MALKPPKQFLAHDTKVWRLFEHLFFMEDEVYPYRIPLPRGQAINLAMGLNRCNIQDACEKGAPEATIRHSAKAKEITKLLPDVQQALLAQGATLNDWCVEISTNQKYQGKTAAPHAMLDGLLAKFDAGSGSASASASPPPSAPDSPARPNMAGKAFNTQLAVEHDIFAQQLGDD
jgi:hypothetical protein